MWTAVSELVWCCHVVLAQDDNYDISFSDPGIPFSVFISARAQHDRSAVLRVAENLVHETMHLQLTLFEDFCPLIDRASGWSMYSPWKQERRPVQGMLHDLYVFYVLRWMWRQISQATHSSTDRDFALRRILDIDEEIGTVHALEDSPALKKAGKRFLQAVFVRKENEEGWIEYFFAIRRTSNWVTSFWDRSKRDAVDKFEPWAVNESEISVHLKALSLHEKRFFSLHLTPD